jgi:hypothetical protein
MYAEDPLTDFWHISSDIRRIEHILDPSEQ